MATPIDVYCHGSACNLVPHRNMLKFLRELNNDKRYSIRRVHAASSGCFVALSLACDIDISTPSTFEFMYTSLSGNMRSILRAILDDDSYLKCNGIVSIWYQRLRKGTCDIEHVEKSHFTSTEDLIDAVLYSSSIPFVTSWILQDSEYFYFDGISVPERSHESAVISLVSECTSLWALCIPSSLWVDCTRLDMSRITSRMIAGSTIRITKESRFIEMGYILCRFYYQLLAYMLYLFC
jgi:hypothetical protein